MFIKLEKPALDIIEVIDIEPRPAGLSRRPAVPAVSSEEQRSSPGPVRLSAAQGGSPVARPDLEVLPPEMPPRPTVGAPSSQRAEPAAPSVSPWLDPVYQPGTLTRLGVQAAVHRLRQGGAQQPAPARGTESVLRLLAAAESDQLAAGSAAGVPPPGVTAESTHQDMRQAAPAQWGCQQPAGIPRAPPDAGSADSHDERLDSIGAQKSEGFYEEEPLPATFKIEPTTPNKSTPALEVTNYCGIYDEVKEEPLLSHPSEGMEVDPSMDPFSTHGPREDDDPAFAADARPAAMKIEVKEEITESGLWLGGADTPVTQLSDVPNADPLAVSADVSMAVGAELSGPSAALREDTDSPFGLPPGPQTQPTPRPAATRGKRRPGRPRIHPLPEAGSQAGPATAVGAAGVAGDDGRSSAARQDAGGRRRKRRKNKWCEKKKKKGPLYTKPQGTGDGEIDPGNMVEVLFLNDDDGQEDYDAMDAMVLKVDMTERPTRYYVHFRDTSYRHDRWVTRSDISRVYRSQLHTPLPLHRWLKPPSEPFRQSSHRRQNDRETALDRGRLVQVVFETTVDGAQLICPAKIVCVDDALSYRRYLVRYLGWQRRYREWVTDSVLRFAPTPLQHNVGGQILRRSVVPPPGCADSAVAAYASMKPCSVDLAAGNVFFLAALRPRPHHINDPRISALARAVRPRRDDPFGSRTAP
ncbi:hypothetical protein FJT64_007200 [Amphibalanus amphitrite]|uniref:Tudor-knot domain-containing protein n=1 Tax=Amphibalanus amphitrite TaxID=1232801 RepID=A0A6A4VWU6_AMPAM|nr:hypothetical protein FJT64_007200 [Amphibalanus amphitrite]